MLPVLMAELLCVSVTVLPIVNVACCSDTVTPQVPSVRCRHWPTGWACQCCTQPWAGACCQTHTLCVSTQHAPWPCMVLTWQWWWVHDSTGSCTLGRRLSGLLVSSLCWWMCHPASAMPRRHRWGAREATMLPVLVHVLVHACATRACSCIELLRSVYILCYCSLSMDTHKVAR